MNKTRLVVVTLLVLVAIWGRSGSQLNGQKAVESIRPTPAIGESGKSGNDKPDADPVSRPTPTPTGYAMAMALPTAAPRPAAALIIANGTVIDGTGAAPVPAGLVVIRDDHILAVGRWADLAIPPHAEVIDVAGRTILPGIINAHVHNAYSAAVRHRFLVEGVTTVCDLGSSLRHISEFEQDYTSTGQPAAHGFRAGPIITVTGGYPSCIYGYSWDYQIATPAEAHAVVIELCNCGADVIKIALEPGHPQHPWPLLSYEQVQAIVTAAHARGVLVRAHIRQAALLDLALAADVDVIEHMPIPFCLEAELEQRLAEGNLHLASYPAYEVQLAKMAAQGVALVPTLDVTSRAIDKLPGLGAEERQAALNFFLEGVCRFHELGGVVALGNDYGNLDVQPGMPIREMELLLAAGLTPLEVIEAATGHAAEVCGHGDELGSLEPGKLADLIVVEGDPLADIQMMSTLRLVIKGGEVVHDLRGERAEPFLNNR